MIILASSKEINEVTDLAIRIWTSNTYQELKEKIGSLLESNEVSIFIDIEDNKAVGFIMCQLRHDYVEGTKHSPVGYLEGVFVEEEYRKRGIARELTRKGIAWAKEQGCLEFASDCSIDNNMSLNFHKAIGFEEVNRIICFKRNI